jgi:hypothetical protein
MSMTAFPPLSLETEVDLFLHFMSFAR